jgi:2-amino-4-hydroxy-6-hydroxymethyldihydropteridine diphosphokinase
MIYKYYLGLGSNIEPRLEYLIKACKQLTSGGKILKKSSLYQTEAWGEKDQEYFINAVIEFESALEPQNLLNEIKNIEKLLGRQQRTKWGPREIDIDILFCYNTAVDQTGLQIPHSRFRERRFVLEPMSELNSKFIVTPGGQTISYFLDSCPDQSYIKKLKAKW